MGRKRTKGGEKNEKSGKSWTREELKSVLDLYVAVNGKGLYETNPDVIALGETLGRTTRSVEAQLLMFQVCDRGGDYGRMNKICRELWEERMPNVSKKITQVMTPSSLVDVCKDNVFINNLLNSAYGGTDAAVMPRPGVGKENTLPVATPPPGVQEVLNSLSNEFKSNIVGIPQWVFFVGGPGNGKSFQLEKFTNDLITAGAKSEKPEKPEGTRYLGELVLGKKRMIVINDASVRPAQKEGAQPGGHLALDLKKAIENQNYCFVNVNRGILIEELADVTGMPDLKVIGSVIQWLVGSGKVTTNDHIQKIGPSSDYYSCAEIPNGASKGGIRLHLVCLDVLSLLETSPARNGCAIQFEKFTPLSCAPYKVMELGSDERWGTPVGSLLGEIIQKSNFEAASCATCSASAYCPFLANIKSLRNKEVGKSLLMMFRASEIASTRLFTFRDFWSLFAVSIIGPIRKEFTERDGSPCSWVKKNSDNLSLSSKLDRQKRIKSLSALGMQRMHAALFSNLAPKSFCGLNEDFELPPQLPVAERLNIIDPAKDASSEWAAAVDEAMSECDFQGKPLESLSGASQVIQNYLADIDKLLENEILEFISTEASEKDIRANRHWLGILYYRLYALCVSHPGERDLVEKWISLRHAVQTDMEANNSEYGTAQGQNIDDGLRALVFPKYSQDSQSNVCMLPIFSSRVEPITDSADKEVLCASILLDGQKAVSFEYVTHGDMIWLVLNSWRNGARCEHARLPLDYFTCREAMVSLGGSGFTEAANTSVPRIERVRATLVRSTAENTSFALVGNTFAIATVRPR